MRLLRTLLVGCALLLPRIAAAQDSTATSNEPITPSQLALARQLVASMHMGEAAAAGVQISLDEQIRTQPTLAPYRTAMQKWATDLFMSDEAQTEFATLYAETFTEDELRQLLAFYSSPVGQKVAARQGSLAMRGAQLGRRLALEHQADLFQRIQNVQPKP